MELYDRTDVIIKRMDEFNRDVQGEVADLFVEAFYDFLSPFSKSKEKLAETFRILFVEEVFYLAEVEGEIVGMIACANNKTRAIPPNKTSLKRGLGFVKGNLAFYKLEPIFNTSLPYPDDGTYIECVATLKKARNKGICTMLFNHIIDHLDYETYILEIGDSNRKTIKLCRKLGFRVFKTIPVENPKKAGYYHRVFMRFEK